MLQKLALVFGGGGSTAQAWEIGVIAGLSRAGSDVTAADLIIGTSAGSTVAAQVTTARPADLLADILSEPDRQPAGPVGSGRDRGPQLQAEDHLERMRRIINAAQGPADYRRRLGAAAVEVGSQSAFEQRRTQRRAVVASRLPSPDWPQQAVRIVAVDARSGEPVVFDSRSGVDLVDAVTASCAGSGDPHRIGDDFYIDGGFRRGENADLAVGYARVLVLSPLGGRSLVPASWGLHLAAQVAQLREGGSRVETVEPDRNSRAVMGSGATVMDPTRRPAAARAGFDQGEALRGVLTL